MITGQPHIVTRGPIVSSAAAAAACAPGILTKLGHIYVRSYRTQENFGGEKLANTMNRELFAMPIFTDTPKMYLAYAAVCSLFGK